ncbi:GNAT family N-acetyltransferase [Streptomyces sp. 71268]|uniref:GNAT family N-acetyltransferase n=1 Tax=Streptomyces sp. 71268 TaxID=3002640 RepID=UPI0023F8161A|nr:GNAT family N-acetyltransferase [Streptomyces sp. 71268]WEV24609.1 GNAT family N-acetyltransferase [Streptomyces sp. 71268]
MTTHQPLHPTPPSATHPSTPAPLTPAATAEVAPPTPAITLTTPTAPTTPAPSERLVVTVCRDPEQFGALADAWDGLYRRCAAATPFQSHAWLHSWWLSYGQRGRLRLVLVHREASATPEPPQSPEQVHASAAPAGTPAAPARELVGAAPLMLRYRPLPTLFPLGLDISDFCDFLLDDRCPRAADALATGLRHLARTALVELREVRPGAAAERVVERWRGPVRRRADSVCLELPGVPMDDLLRRLSGASARNARRKLRRVDELGITHRAVAEHEVPGAVATMLALHGQQWQGRGVTPEHLRPRFAEHLARATRQLVRTGDAALTEYRLGDLVLVSEVTLFSRHLAGGYLYGAHPEARAKVDIATMLLRQDAARATATGRRVLSLLRGDEPYKRHWRPETVVNRRLLLARRRLAPALWLRAGHLTARGALANLARTRLPVLLAWRSRLRARRTGGTPR